MLNHNIFVLNFLYASALCIQVKLLSVCDSVCMWLHFTACRLVRQISFFLCICRTPLMTPDKRHCEASVHTNGHVHHLNAFSLLLLLNKQLFFCFWETATTGPNSIYHNHHKTDHRCTTLQLFLGQETEETHHGDFSCTQPSDIEGLLRCSADNTIRIHVSFSVQ